MFFHLQPAAALLADLNSELITCYRALARDVELVIQCYNRLPRGREGYYGVRAIDPASLSEAEAAARFLYLNRHCFNGLYRTNKSGRFNVPYGPPKHGDVDISDRIREASRALRGVQLLNVDFADALRHVKPGDFVYLDPPYAIEDRRVFAEYLPGSFSTSDLERLALALQQLDDAGVPFVVSYADSREARKLLAPWGARRIWTRRNIAGFTGARRGSYELLATNQR